MNLNTLIAILTTVIILVVGGVLAFVFYYRQRTRRLKEDFGPEYNRALEEVGNRKQAEDVLENRQERIESFRIRKLEPEEREQFLKKWTTIRADFVNDPGVEVEEADRLITEVMLARGYPMTQFDQRVENLSVNHPEVVSLYRQAHSVTVKNRQSNVNTEELRQAMLKYQMLFDELLELHESTSQKPERMMAD
jgi:CHAT domain-containing protein